MIYEIVYTEDARRSLKEMDAAMSAAIISRIDRNLAGTDSTCRSSKALTGEPARVWRYRVGDFRIFAELGTDGSPY